MRPPRPLPQLPLPPDPLPCPRKIPGAVARRVSTIIWSSLPWYSPSTPSPLSACIPLETGSSLPPEAVNSPGWEVFMLRYNFPPTASSCGSQRLPGAAHSAPAVSAPGQLCRDWGTPTLTPALCSPSCPAPPSSASVHRRLEVAPFPSSFLTSSLIPGAHLFYACLLPKRGPRNTHSQVRRQHRPSSLG